MKEIPCDHVHPDLVNPVVRGLPGRRRRRAHDGDRADERGRGEEAHAVNRVAQARTEGGHQRACGSRAENPDAHHRDLHQRIRREQPLARDMAADRDRLGRREKAGDRAERNQDGIDLPERRREDEHDHESRPDQVARHERRLERPAIDEYAGERPQQREREHVGDLHARDLRRRAVHPERDDADDREKSQEVAEQADDLGIPDPAHHGDAEDLLEGHRRGDSVHRALNIT